ncbi:DNA-processing protein DprA [Candidatus Kaiserbacteria bacterium]|nr:DNA-processing protein DprA [Candidatus Kaiserbacteria bacterium]USN92216.1 MAG: DNA-protecting protein DprA [Candidatus Nomurabacteria bacterium]
MNYSIEKLPAQEFPVGLREIPEPPKTLYYRGRLPDRSLTLLSIVGSRNYTSYGKQVVDELVGGLAGYEVGIISGLALGIDSLAHESALRHNLYTLAIPGSGLEDSVMYPATHKNLAYKILEAGGGLLSEFEPTFKATKWSFPMRNRLIAGISKATLLIEAAEKSGTLITARLATDYNRELLVVPGSIFSKNSVGVHQFMKLGATPITMSEDILDCLRIDIKSIERAQPKPTLSTTESLILSLLPEPTHRDELIRKTKLGTQEASQLLMMMELNGYIKSDNNIYRSTL